MKATTIHLTTLALLPAALFTLTSCSCTSPSQPPPPVGSARLAYTEGVPGGVVLQTFKTTATVTAIDQAKRKATLLGPEGKKFTVKVGPEAVNLDQIRVGDQVNATVTQRIVVSLEPEGAASSDGTAAVVARAPKGDQPAGLAAETTQVTARLIAVDSAKRTATLGLPDGTTEAFPIREDVDLSRLKAGDQVVFRVTEMTAIWVEKPQ
jgi:hypothetical protein